MISLPQQMLESACPRTRVRPLRSNGQHASCGAVSSPSDYAKQSDLTHPERGIYALTDNTTDAEFDDALNTARDEGNVSRANVVRKIKEANGTAPANEPTRHHENTR